MSRSWTPDGRRVVFTWIKPDGLRELAWQAADGATPPEKLAEDGEPGCWTPDGKELIGLKDRDIWVVADLGGGAGRRPIVTSTAEERYPALSPNGRWLVYGSNESGRFEVYIQPYPGPGDRVTASTDGGDNPVWHPGGRELFFLSRADATGVRHMMSVSLQPGLGLRPGPPRPLFPFRDPDLRFAANPFSGFEVAPDGEHFVTTQAVPSPPLPPVTQIHLVLNWIEDVKAKLAKQ